MVPEKTRADPWSSAESEYTNRLDLGSVIDPWSIGDRMLSAKMDLGSVESAGILQPTGQK